ncbi:hypothetical protein [Streptomyces sp. G-G2]|uniref:hypothetical protein n=1 Tax=Streptomyces sp. G-G2 TaxID=3046201 RepID=UPI0024B8C43C|nr:hypothetical protein [Streptomyces sp. G-G2]MDJ0381086.1 hypothetical protein [Streptomyces sp. G-G2]
MARSTTRRALGRIVATAGLLVGLAAGGVAAGNPVHAAAHATARTTAPATAQAAAREDMPELPDIQQPVSQGTFTFAGDSDDRITQGRTKSFGTPEQEFLIYRSVGSNMAEIRVRDGDTWWYLAFGAPQGRQLTPGVYPGATQFPFHGNSPGVDFSGDGRYCAAVTGSFTIHHIEWNPHGWLDSLDADFEQRCAGAAAASHGTVRVEAPPAPPVLALTMSAARIGTVTAGGEATLHGTVRCNKTASVNVFAYVVQQQGAARVTGWVREVVDCAAGTSVPWQGTVGADDFGRFRDGWADTTAGAQAMDWDYLIFTHAPGKNPRVCLGHCGS